MARSPNTITAGFMVRRLQQLRMAELPVVLRAVGRDILLDLTREGALNIRGRVLDKTRPNAELARYFTSALVASVEYLKSTIRAGLPASDLSARILAHRETGGVIRMKDKMLRIPLAPALTAAGEDRYAGVNLKGQYGPRYERGPFRVVKMKSGALFLALKREKGSKSGLALWYRLQTQEKREPRPWWSNAVMATRARVPEFIAAHLAKLGDTRVTP